ncbi:MAG: FkbM family methyltransferase [Verrucomicrobiae bacterium]|nr:FkbM family methyltransferase [Verrucomicrobiae bacterium]
MIQTIKKLLILKRRKQAARQLGFDFRRAAGFELPAKIRADSRSLSLNLPQDEGTRTAFVDVLLDDCYRLRTFPKNIKTVLDIGAHAGLFSLAARLNFPDAIIHAYEPNPQLLPLLSHQAYAGKFSFFGEAVGLVAGRMSLDSGADSVQTRAHRNEQGDIHCTSFAAAVAKLGPTIDLVKMDCEGGEWEILKDEVTWAKVQNITMEFHLWAGYSLEELKARVVKLGFAVNHCHLAGKDFGLLQAARN